MFITRVSPFSGKKHTMILPITEEQYKRWEVGEMIQNAMPNLSPDEREFVMTGITPQEWKETFGD